MGDICGCEAADDCERPAVETAFVQNGEPLLCSEGCRCLHYGRHSDERKTCIRALISSVMHARKAVGATLLLTKKVPACCDAECLRDE